MLLKKKKIILISCLLAWLFLFPHQLTLSKVNVAVGSYQLLLEQLNLKFSLYAKPELIIGNITGKMEAQKQVSKPSFVIQTLAYLKPYKWLQKIKIEHITSDPYQLRDITIQQDKDQLTISLNKIQFSYFVKQKNLEIQTPKGLIKAKHEEERKLQFYEPYPFELSLEEEAAVFIFNELIQGNIRCDLNTLTCRANAIDLNIPSIGKATINSLVVEHDALRGLPYVYGAIKDIDIRALPQLKEIDFSTKNLKSENHYEIDINKTEKIIFDPLSKYLVVYDHDKKQMFHAWQEDQFFKGEGKLFVHDFLVRLQDSTLNIKSGDIVSFEVAMNEPNLHLDFENVSAFYNQSYFIKNGELSLSSVGLELLLKNVAMDDAALESLKLFTDGQKSIGSGILSIDVNKLFSSQFNTLVKEVIKPSLYLRYSFHQEKDKTRIIFLPEGLMGPSLTLDSLVVEQTESSSIWRGRGYYKNSPVDCELMFDDQKNLKRFFCHITPEDYKNYFKLKNGFVEPISFEGHIEDSETNIFVHLNSFESRILPGISTFLINKKGNSDVYSLSTRDKSNLVLIDCTHPQACELIFNANIVHLDREFFAEKNPSKNKSLHFRTIKGDFTDLSFEDLPMTGSVLKIDDEFILRLDSEKIKGDFLENKNSIAVNLEEFDLNWFMQKIKDFSSNANERKKKSSLFTKELTFECQDLKWKNQPLGAVSLTHKNVDIDHSQSIKLEHKNLKIETSGKFDLIESEFSGTIETGNLGNFLNTFSKKNNVRDGNAKIVFNKLLVNQDEKKIEGSIDISLKKLFIMSDDQQWRAFRILNMLSGYIFSKQHKRSLVTDGFPIDKMTANFNVLNNQVYVKNLYLKSGATEFFCDGLFDPFEKKIDLDLYVSPKVSKALPTAAFLVGNIPAALALIGVNYVAGDDINKFNRKRFHVHGPFDQIKVEPWTAEVVEKN